MKLDNAIVQAFWLILSNNNVKHYYDEVVLSSFIPNNDVVVVWLFKAERFDMMSEPQRSVVFSDDSVIFRKGTYRKGNKFACGVLMHVDYCCPKLTNYFEQCKDPDNFDSMLPKGPTCYVQIG